MAKDELTLNQIAKKIYAGAGGWRMSKVSFIA